MVINKKDENRINEDINIYAIMRNDESEEITKNIQIHMEFLKNKFGVFNIQQEYLDGNKISYNSIKEKIINNKILSKHIVDDKYIYNYFIIKFSLTLKKIINENDNFIKTLYEEISNQNIHIKQLNQEILNLKKQKQEQEESFQNIIKDFQFLNEFNSTNNNNTSNINFNKSLTTNSSNYDSNFSNAKVINYQIYFIFSAYQKI